MDGDSKGYDVVVFNYRGLAGIELYTPLLFCSNSYKDQLDPMKYIYEKYCKPNDRKCFAIGCSMGANILANILGYEGTSSFITAACVVQAPIKKWKCAKAIKNNFYGIYNKALGQGINDIVLQHEPMLRDMVKEKTGLDIIETIQSKKPTVLQFDELFTAPIFGYDSQDDYYRKAACFHRIPNIAVPTFFMNAMDDPIVGDEAIDFEVVK